MARKTARYAVCKLKYAQEGDPKKGTIDGIVYDPQKEIAFPYSLIYYEGRFLRFAPFSCFHEASFEGLLENIDDATTAMQGAFEWMCIENRSRKDVLEIILADFPEPKHPKMWPGMKSAVDMAMRECL